MFPKRNQGFYDSYFIETIIPKLKRDGILPPNVGNVVAFGNEGVIMEYSAGKVIKLVPTYEMFPDSDGVDYHLNKLKSIPDFELFVKIFEVGKLKGYDEEVGDNIVYAVYAVMEKLDQLTRDEKFIIDEVVSNPESVESLPDSDLKDFLRIYVKMRGDISSDNVMKRNDKYIIIDL
jgi:hypothetical protein